MISLAPILSNIQATLNEKITMLKKREGSMEQSDDGHEIFVPSNEIGAPITEGGVVNENYMFARTPFFRMSSFTDSTTGPVVIMGGELDFHHRMRGGFNNRAATVNDTVSPDKKINYNGLYHQSGNMPLRPIAGVESIDVAYKGGGMRLGATRSGDIKWICHTWEDLQKFTPHFLAHGKTILLEWGWSGIGKLKDVMFYPLFTDDLAPKFIKENVDGIGEKLISHIEEQNGHYDAMIGKIKSFDWTVKEDGGFDCTTELISPGVILMEKKFKNLTSPLLSELPTLASRTIDAKVRYFTWFNTEAKYTSNSQDINLGQLAPYITFKTYMNDFPQQIERYISLNVPNLQKYNDKASTGTDNGWGKHPTKKGRFRVALKGKFAWDEENKQNWQGPFTSLLHGGYPGSMINGIGEKVLCGSHIEWEDYEIQTTYPKKEEANKGAKADATVSAPSGKKRDPVQKLVKIEDRRVVLGGNDNNVRAMYVTWGWFEDNVLSRFFGHIVKNQTEVLGEFRSIESYQSASGKSIKGKKAGEEKDYSEIIKQSTRMYNSKYLMTVDSGKWLIPNPGDLVLQNIVHWFGNKDEIKALYETEADIAIKAKASGGEVFESVHDVAKFSIAINKATADYMPMRNILFNVSYLKSKLENVEDLASGVQAIWDDFSSTYGGVYRFKMEMTDGGEGMMLKEEGYTQHSVKQLLDNNTLKSIGEEPSGAELFVFPTWEAGSIVKSQNINAKLPGRMQIAAMYGTSTAGSVEDEKEDRVYDEMAAIAWGKLNTNAEPEKSPTDVLADYYSGDIDYPSRGNRTFGRTDARESMNLHIQKYNPGLVLQSEAASDTGPGIKIYNTIYTAVDEAQTKELQNREAAYLKANPTAGDDSGNVNISSTEAEKQIMKEIMATFDSTKGPIDSWQQLYTIKLGSVNTDKGYPVMKQEVQGMIQKFFRGGDDSILDKVDPLIPIDFEMEIDGTGGMFPGNSFHSSYLSERYQEEALFQMKGVSHKLDSSGWTTTIVGQIRTKRAVDPIEKLASGGAGKGGDNSAASSNKGGKKVGPNGEEVFQQSSGARKFYYRDSKNVDSKTGKGVIKWWKGNPEAEHISVFPKDQDKVDPESGDETKDPKPITWTVKPKYLPNPDNLEYGTGQDRQNTLLIGTPQNFKVHGSWTSLPNYTIGETFLLTMDRLKKEKPGLLMSKLATKSGNKKAIDILKKFNPDSWMIWGNPGDSGIEAFPRDSIIIVGWDDEPGTEKNPGGTNVGLGWDKYL